MIHNDSSNYKDNNDYYKDNNYQKKRNQTIITNEYKNSNKS